VDVETWAVAEGEQVVAKGIRAAVRARGQLLEPGGAWVIEVRGRLLRAREHLLRVHGLDARDAWGA